MFVNINGCFYPQENAQISVFDRGLLLGDGWFETLRVENGKIHALSYHLKRFIDGFDIRGYGCDVCPEMIESRLKETMEKNQLTCGVLRLTLTLGQGPRGLLAPLKPKYTLMIVAFERENFETQPARVGFASCTCRNEKSPLSQLKSLNYLDGILAAQEAQKRNLDDCILLNTCGQVAETSCANIFIIQDDGMMCTPELSHGALPGVVRSCVIDFASFVGFQVKEKGLSSNDILQAKGVILTNSLVGLRWVEACENKAYDFSSYSHRIDELASKIFS